MWYFGRRDWRCGLIGESQVDTLRTQEVSQERMLSLNEKAVRFLSVAMT